MSCFETRNFENRGFENRGCNQIITTTRSNVNTINENTIAGLLRKIDQMQRAAIANNALSRCDNCLINAMHNTKPIAVYCGCSRFAVEDGGMCANLFRVEEVRGNETVVLRLLEVDGDSVVCTRHTIVMRIDCICCIQCFEPINCAVACFKA